MPVGTSLVVRKQEEKALSWGEIDWMIEVAVANMRRLQYRPTRIIPIGGGGLIPAALLAYRFYKKDNLPVNVLPPVYAKSYTPDHKQGQISIAWPDNIQAYDCSETLFVDDICDTGRTLWVIRERMRLSPCYCIITKIPDMPEWFTTLDRENRWWIFPWEKDVPQNIGPQAGS